MKALKRASAYSSEPSWTKIEGGSKRQSSMYDYGPDGPRSGVRVKSRRSSAFDDESPSRRGSRSTQHRDDSYAFVDPGVGPAFDWQDAESFAGEFIASATAAEQVNEDARDEFVVEELGGPFVDLAVEEHLSRDAVQWFGEEDSVAD